MKTSAVLVAGGRGVRAGFELPKQFLTLCNKPILCYSLDLFEACTLVHEVILVLPQDYISYFQDQIASRFFYSKLKSVVAGGENRQESTQAGMKKIGDDINLVCVHDAARPLLKMSLLEQVIQLAAQKKAALLAAPASDTIKEVDDQKAIVKTHAREKIYLAQTPQVFEIHLLRKAFEKAKVENFLGTDEASLVEAMGEEVFIVESTPLNLKVTQPQDFKIAEILLQETGVN
ncbi:MAG: 2-C-methyl-D-erythritol 4-phosphate cytidylyltransferase [Deltaproteobacteria bacterium]|nr:2-C-methyl-D-erythritol 4-phosphate cytidylyltransferase [Deltaproteobacteria bacterium]